jgi:hypothetical protein
MVELHVRHIAPARPWRDEQSRRAESKPPILVSRKLVGDRDGRRRRRHVVEKATPFIEIDVSNVRGQFGPLVTAR